MTFETFEAAVSHAEQHLALPEDPAHRIEALAADLMVMSRDLAARERVGVAVQRRARFAEQLDAQAEAQDSVERRTAVLVSAGEVTTRPPEPLWAPRLYFGKVVLLEGAPGVSKTTLVLDVIARASRGGPMPDSTGTFEPIRSLILSAEDDPADTLVPRLRLAGADLSRVHFMTGKVQRDGQEDDDLAVPGDMDVLRDGIQRTGARLVLVDPLFAYLHTQADSHTDHKVRRSLGPLHRLAAEMGVCIVAIRHHRKAAGADPVNAGGGSIGIIGAARLALLVARDPDDEAAVLLAGVKSNIGAQPPTLRYRLETGELPEHPGVEWTRIKWEGVSERTASDILAAQADQRAESRSPRAEAEEWLAEVLAAAPVSALEVKREATAAGLSWRTVERAKADLGVRSRKVSGGWVWVLEGSTPPTPPRPPASESGGVGGLGEGEL